jgi:hypothetical protein
VLSRLICRKNVPPAGESRLRLSKDVESDENESDFDINTLKQSGGFELPQIEFEELEKLKLRRTLVEEDITTKPLVEEYKDSWAQFGVGINKIRESINRIKSFLPGNRIGRERTFSILYFCVPTNEAKIR